MERIKSSTKFCHFTTMDNARNIIQKEKIFLSKYSAMNDGLESSSHEDEDGKVFSLSFCHSESLNIPQFYLYSGIDGKGCRLQFTDSKINEILSNIKVYPVNKNYGCRKRPFDADEYEVLYDWIHYIPLDGRGEYRGKEDYYDSLDKAKEVLTKNNKQYFIKNPIWKYEKEFRIIVKLKNKIKYDRVALAIDVKDNERGISIKLGPEVTGAEYDEIKNEFSDYGIRKIEMSSEYKIAMNLIKRNEKIFWSNKGRGN